MLAYLLYAYTIIHKYTFWMLDPANSRIFVVEMIQTIVWSAVHTNNFQMQARGTWLFSNKLTQLNKLLYYTCHVSYKNELLNGIVRQEKVHFEKKIVRHVDQMLCSCKNITHTRHFMLNFIDRLLICNLKLDA